MPTVEHYELGCLPYADALLRQQAEWERVAAWREAGADVPAGVLLTLEHEPVLTVGRRAGAGELGLDEAAWRARGVEVLPTRRGGRVTYHGPGQLVLYPILDLARLMPDLHRYIEALEECAIRLLADYGISAHRDPEHTGVWAGTDKLAAIGVQTRRWVSLHGMAVNGDMDCGIYRDFVPCGIRGRGVSSVRERTGRAVDMAELRERTLGHFEAVFGLRLERRRPSIP